MVGDGTTFFIFRQENRAKNREKAAENQRRRFQKAWFWVPALIFECSKTKTGGFSAGLIFSTDVRCRICSL